MQDSVQTNMEKVKLSLHEIVQNVLGISLDVQMQILFSILLFIFIWALRRIISKFIIEKFEDYKERYFWGKTLKTVTVIFALIVLSRIWFGIFESIGTFMGLLSAGLAIAFQDLLVNIGGWLFITIRKPFKNGDRVQIGDVTGDVIDIRLFQFSVIEVGNWVDADQSTGRIIHIPNGYVFTKWQANYTEGFEYIWDEIPVLLTFDLDGETVFVLRDEYTDDGSHLNELGRKIAARELIRTIAKKIRAGEAQSSPGVGAPASEL